MCSSLLLRVKVTLNRVNGRLACISSSACVIKLPQTTKKHDADLHMLYDVSDLCPHLTIQTRLESFLLQRLQDFHFDCMWDEFRPPPTVNSMQYLVLHIVL